MKVKLRKLWASALGCFPPGSVVSVDRDVGKALIDSRQAEDAGGEEVTKIEVAKPEPEAATIEQEETADLPPARKRRAPKE
jgi:hypothetical protein